MNSAAPKQPSRSLLVTLLGLLVMAVSGVLSLVSLLALLMILGGGYGTQTSDPAGFLTVVVAPPCAFVAGLGLILRWRLARWFLIALFVVMAVVSVRTLARGGYSTTIRTTADGQVTKTEEKWGGPDYITPATLAASVAGLVLLLLPSVRREFHPPRRAVGGAVPPPLPGPAAPPASAADTARGWRVGHRGRDMMFYEELVDGVWQRLEIDGEMLTGRAHHVIFFDGPARWASKPAWARHRRDEILGRIKSEFRAPDYEYMEYDGLPAPAVPPPAPATPVLPPATLRQNLAALLFVAILAALAAYAGWQFHKGWSTGTTFLPHKRPSLQRTVTHDREPATYWLCMGVFGLVAVSSAAGACWISFLALQGPATGARR